MLRVQRLDVPSSRCHGERCIKDTDHRGVHFVVHLANDRSMKEDNSLETAERTEWARCGNGLGLERPHCSAR
jgi:hypothetical protein